MSCSHLKSCPLFAQFALHPALSIWQEHYCDNEHAKCARYQKSATGAAVPVTLLPNGKLLSARQSETEMHGVVLLNAVMKNRSWMLTNLLEKVGADVNFQNIEGTSALMVAAENGYVEMVRILLVHGANPALKNVGGETAVDIAKRQGHAAVAVMINNYGPKTSAVKQSPAVKAERKSA